jgi:hypothetical protein
MITQDHLLGKIENYKNYIFIFIFFKSCGVGATIVATTNVTTITRGNIGVKRKKTNKQNIQKLNIQNSYHPTPTSI